MPLIIERLKSEKYYRNFHSMIHFRTALPAIVGHFLNSICSSLPLYSETLPVRYNTNYKTCGPDHQSERFLLGNQWTFEMHQTLYPYREQG